MRSIKLFLAITIILMQTGCQEDKTIEKAPENILSNEQFADILMNFSLAESISNLNIKNIPVHLTDSVYAFNPVKEQGARQSQYDSTVAYYIEHPALYKEAYELALARLTELESKNAAAKTQTNVQSQSVQQSPVPGK